MHWPQIGLRSRLAFLRRSTSPTRFWSKNRSSQSAADASTSLSYLIRQLAEVNRTAVTSVAGSASHIGFDLLLLRSPHVTFFYLRRPTTAVPCDWLHPKPRLTVRASGHHSPRKWPCSKPRATTYRIFGGQQFRKAVTLYTDQTTLASFANIISLHCAVSRRF